MKKVMPKSAKQTLSKSSINKPASKEEILKTIRRCAGKLKRTPTFRDLKAAGIDRTPVEWVAQRTDGRGG
jgi:hypothetical protein